MMVVKFCGGKFIIFLSDYSIYKYFKGNNSLERANDIIVIFFIKYLK